MATDGTHHHVHIRASGRLKRSTGKSAEGTWGCARERTRSYVTFFKTWKCRGWFFPLLWKKETDETIWYEKKFSSSLWSCGGANAFITWGRSICWGGGGWRSSGSGLRASRWLPCPPQPGQEPAGSTQQRLVAVCPSCICFRNCLMLIKCVTF